MKRLILTALAFALMSGPTFAGCGSHGGYGASSARASYSSTWRPAQAYASKPAKAAAARPAIREANATGGSAPEAGKSKPAAAPAAAQPIKTVSAVQAATLADQSLAASAECKKYSATIGAMIAVACE